MAGKNGENPANEKKLESLQEQLTEVINKREELSVEVNRLTTIALKLQGVIEYLQQTDNSDEE